jgi:hypothetical protein
VRSTREWVRWRAAQLRGHNPLVRASDRTEAVVAVLVVAVSACALFVGIAVGADAGRSAEVRDEVQRLDRHQVTATVTDVIGVRPRPASALVRVVWRADGQDRTGTVRTRWPVAEGAPTTIWLDATGAPVAAPPPRWRAVLEGAGAALAVWSVVTVVSVGMFAALRAWTARRRGRNYDRELIVLRSTSR